jgi:hypothetical protein
VLAGVGDDGLLLFGERFVEGDGLGCFGGPILGPSLFLGRLDFLVDPLLQLGWEPAVVL